MTIHLFVLPDTRRPFNRRRILLSSMLLKNWDKKSCEPSSRCVIWFLYICEATTISKGTGCTYSKVISEVAQILFLLIRGFELVQEYLTYSKPIFIEAGRKRWRDDDFNALTCIVPFAWKRHYSEKEKKNSDALYSMAKIVACICFELFQNRLSGKYGQAQGRNPSTLC